LRLQVPARGRCMPVPPRRASARPWNVSPATGTAGPWPPA